MERLVPRKSAGNKEIRKVRRIDVKQLRLAQYKGRTFAPGLSLRFFLLECGSNLDRMCGVRGVVSIGVLCCLGSTYGAFRDESGRRPALGIICFP
jgi:hypothetical protein